MTEHIPTHKERAPDEVIDFQYNVTVFRGKLTSIVYIYIYRIYEVRSLYRFWYHSILVEVSRCTEDGLMQFLHGHPIGREVAHLLQERKAWIRQVEKAF